MQCSVPCGGCHFSDWEHHWLEWSALTLSYNRVLCGGKLQKPTVRKHKESKPAQHKACACKVVAQREGCQLGGCCGMWLSSPGLLALSQEGQQLSCSLPLWHLISKRRDPQASSGLGSEKWNGKAASALCAESRETGFSFLTKKCIKFSSIISPQLPVLSFRTPSPWSSFC